MAQPANKESPRLQNRDRSSPASIQQMQSIASQPDFGRLGYSRDFANGAPVIVGNVEGAFGKTDYAVASDGRRIPVQYAVVPAHSVATSNDVNGAVNSDYESAPVKAVAGNGRMAGLSAAHDTGNAQGYRDELIAELASLGIDPEEVNAIENPVLVRVMPQGEVTQNIGDISNTSGNLSLSAVEQAANDARRLDVSGLSFNEDGSISPQSVRQFVASMPQTEQGNLIDSNGQPTRQAYDRLEAALFSNAYGDAELTRLLAQATDTEARNIIASLSKVAAKMQRLIGAGELDIRAVVVDAAKIAINARRNNRPLAEVAVQVDLDAVPGVEIVLSMMAKDNRSAARMAEKLERLADLAYREATRPDTDMFGNAPAKMSRREILESLNEGEIHDASAKRLEHEKRSSTTPEHPERGKTDGQGSGNPVAHQGIESPKPEISGEEQGQAFQLTGQTNEEAAADHAAQQQEAADKAKADREATARERAEREHREIRDRSATASETFELGGNAEDNLSGQGGLFDERPQVKENAVPLIKEEAKLKEKSAGDGVAFVDALLAGDYDLAKQKYTQLKAAYPGRMLFFRMGDYYNLFFEDAEKAATLLDSVITRRTVPSTGVPAHYLDEALKRLEASGKSSIVLNEAKKDSSQNSTVAANGERDTIAPMKPSRAARNDSTQQPSETPAAQNGKAEPLDTQPSPDGQERGTRAKERAEAGKRVRDFVEAVLSKDDHPHSITIQVATEEKREKVLAETGVDIGGAREILIDDRVVHAQKDHPSLTLDDWALLPEIAETFDESYLGRKEGDPRVQRIIFVKRGEPKDYVYLAQFAHGASHGKGDRLTVITFMKDTRQRVNNFLKENEIRKGEVFAGTGLEPARPEGPLPTSPRPTIDQQSDESKVNDRVTPSPRQSAGEEIMGIPLSKYSDSDLKKLARKGNEKAKNEIERRKASEPAKEKQGLRVGTTAITAQPVTVQDGVIHIGEEPAYDYETGEPVRIQAGATDQQIMAALEQAGTLTDKQKFFGISKPMSGADRAEIQQKSRGESHETLAGEGIDAGPPTAQKQGTGDDKRARVKSGETVSMSDQEIEAWRDEGMPEGLVIKPNLDEKSSGAWLVSHKETPKSSKPSPLTRLEVEDVEGGYQVVGYREDGTVTRSQTHKSIDSALKSADKLAERHGIDKVDFQEKAGKKTGSTAGKIRESLTKRFGNAMIAALEKAGVLKIHETAKDAARAFSGNLPFFGEKGTTSLKSEMARWARELEGFGKKDGKRHTAKMNVPAVLHEMGIKARELSLSGYTALDIAQTHPEITLDMLRDLPQMLSSPLFVYPYHDGSARGEKSGLTVITQTTDKRGNPVRVGIRFTDGKISTIFGVSEGWQAVYNQAKAALKEFPNEKTYVGNVDPPIGSDAARGIGNLSRGRAASEGDLRRAEGDTVDYRLNSLHPLFRGRRNVITRESLVNKYGPNYFQSAFHGSPHRFKKFMLEHIGTGEGHQAFGWGLYFAGNRAVAEDYQSVFSLFNGVVNEEASRALEAFGTKEDAIAALEFGAEAAPDLRIFDEAIKVIKTGEKRNEIGQLYEVNIPENDVLLDWDKPLSEQPEKVKEALRAADYGGLNAISHTWDGKDFLSSDGDILTGEKFYRKIGNMDNEKASRFLNAIGIKGIRYLDGNSRSEGKGSHNYVIFDENAIEMLNTFYQMQSQESHDSRLTNAQGFFDRDSGTIHLVAENLSEGEAAPTLLHEALHKALSKMLGTKRYQKLMNRLSLIEKADGKANEWFQKAKERIPEADRANRSRYLNELAAYAITEYESAPRTLPESIAKWVQDFIANIRAFLMDHFGFDPKNLSAADLSAIARRHLESAARETSRNERFEPLGGHEAFASMQNSVDASYFAAIEAGDMDAAQKIVDQVAAKKGYISKTDYRMSHQAPSSQDADVSVNLANVMENGLVPKDYWTHPQYYQSDPRDRSSFYAVKDKALNPVFPSGKMKSIWMYRAIPKDVKDGSFRNGDWISPSREYAQDEGKSIPGGYRVIAQKVSLDHVWWDANSINEFGYDDGKGYAYKDTKNNRKLTDAVVRDHDGNIVPPSERFNDRKSETFFQGSLPDPESPSYRATEKAYGGKAAYEKAKTAGKTKLNYRQWVQVRTPEFKNWFGDWEAAHMQTRFDGMKPIAINVPEEWKSLPIEELRERVRKAMDDLIASNDPLHHPDIGDVMVKSSKKSLSSSRDPAKLMVIGDLRNAFEKSIYSSSSVPMDQSAEPNVEAYEKLLAKVDIGGKELAAIFTVKRQSDGRHYYNTMMLEDVNGKTPAVSPAVPESGRSTPAYTEVDSFIRRSLKRVNPDSVSKVTNPETGEPLVVYHNTNADFDVFKTPAWFGIEAWTPKGELKFPVFLNIVDPLRYDTYFGHSDFSLPSKFKWYEKESKKWVTPDGAIGKDGVYVAFSPNQIKSATGNNGAFSPDNNNIYLQEGKPETKQQTTKEAKRDETTDSLKAAEDAADRWKRLMYCLGK